MSLENTSLLNPSIIGRKRESVCASQRKERARRMASLSAPSNASDTCNHHAENREVPRFADYGYSYILAIRKVFTYSESSARPDFSDYGYGYV